MARIHATYRSFLKISQVSNRRQALRNAKGSIVAVFTAIVGFRPFSTNPHDEGGL